MLPLPSRLEILPQNDLERLRHNRIFPPVGIHRNVPVPSGYGVLRQKITAQIVSKFRGVDAVVSCSGNGRNIGSKRASAEIESIGAEYQHYSK